MSSVVFNYYGYGSDNIETAWVTGFIMKWKCEHIFVVCLTIESYKDLYIIKTIKKLINSVILSLYEVKG